VQTCKSGVAQSSNFEAETGNFVVAQAARVRVPAAGSLLISLNYLSFERDSTHPVQDSHTVFLYSLDDAIELVLNTSDILIALANHCITLTVHEICALLRFDAA
jgi:hypothetical protein